MLESLQDILQIVIWILGPLLILLILLQGGAGDVGSAFGGGGQLDSALGVGANRKMAKLTGWLSFLFLAMVVVLAMPTAVSFNQGASPAAAAATGDGTMMSAPAGDAAVEPVADPAPVPDAPSTDGAADAAATDAAATDAAATDAVDANTPTVVFEDDEEAAPAPAVEPPAADPQP